MKFTFTRVAALMGLAFSFSAQESQSAGLVISFSQSGTDVVMTVNGTVDITGLSFFGNIGSAGNELGSNVINGDRAYTGLVGGDDYYVIPLVYDLFDSGVFGTLGASTGDGFGIYTEGGIKTYLYFADGFTGGTINGELTVPTTDLADLGVTPFSHSWGPGSNQSFQVIPEPSTPFLVALAIIGGGLVRRKRN